MGRYLLVRLYSMALTLAGLTVLIFLMLRLIPGTVVEQMIGADAIVSPAMVAELTRFFGLDQPWWLQYSRWLGALPRLSVPVFWQGTMLILFFSIYLRWMPPLMWVDFFTDPRRNMTIMVLPAICLGTASAANIARITRACMLDVLRSEYIRTASAKGLTRRLVILKHALKNALIPIVTVAGLQMGILLGGTVVVEEVFTLPGVGRLVLWAIYQRDYPLTQSTILFIAVMFMTINLMVDLLYRYLDPRIRYSG